MSGIKFNDKVPDKMVHFSPATSARKIVRRVKKEYYPVNQVDYTYSGNKEIEFHISSNQAFLDQHNSYLRFNFRTKGTHDGSTNDFRRYLSEGGVSNLFKKVEILTPEGKVLDSIDEYGKLYNIMSNLFHSPEHIDRVEWASGDSMDRKPTSSSPEMVLTGGWTLVADDETITSAGTDGSATTELKVGDVVIAKTSQNVEVYRGRVHTITDDDNIECVPAPDKAVASDGATLYTFRQPSRVLACSPDNSALTTTGLDLSMKVFSGLFNIEEYLPIFLLGGVILKFTLRESEYPLCISDEQALSASATLDYQLSSVRFVAELVTPSQDIRKQYMDLYSQNALVFSYPSYWFTMKSESGASGNINLTLPVSKNSVNRCMFVCQNNRATTIVNSADRQTDTLSYDMNTFIDGKISSYQFQVGGENYPQLKVDCSDAYMSEAWNELTRTFGIHGSASAEMRLQPQKWAKYNENSDTGAFDSSHKAIFATCLSKDCMDPLAGLNTKSDSNIQVNIETSGAHNVNGSQSNRYFLFWVEYTKSIQLGANGVVIYE